MVNLRHQAQALFCEPNPSQKVSQMAHLWAQQKDWLIEPSWQAPTAQLCKPMGRPAKPRLIPHKDLPKRKLSTPLGLASLVHAICHIEFNAINLALDAVWRFAGMPKLYYSDWTQVAYEEATHFELLSNLLVSMGHEYGDFDAHDGLWEMCEKTQQDITARMALVPRTLEARGLDASPLIQEKLLRLSSPFARQAFDILNIILNDEISHVRVGNRWYLWLCESQKADPNALYARLSLAHAAPRLKPPFNLKARAQAGFTQEELRVLASSAQAKASL